MYGYLHDGSHPWRPSGASQVPRLAAPAAVPSGSSPVSPTIYESPGALRWGFLMYGYLHRGSHPWRPAGASQVPRLPSAAAVPSGSSPVSPTNYESPGALRWGFLMYGYLHVGSHPWRP